MSNNKCENCVHYRPEWAPYIKRNVMTCELPNHHYRCDGDYEPKEKKRK